MRDWCCGRSILLTASITGFEVWRRVRASEFVFGQQAGFAVHQEEHRVCLGDRRSGLLLDRAVEALFCLSVQPGGVDDQHAARADFDFGRDPIPGDARHVFDERPAHARKPIEEGRFPDVRAADDGDDREV